MTKSVATFTPGSTMPAYAESKAPKGNEDVTASDMAIPRLSILQQLSPALDDSSAKYVEGAKAGQILESVTGTAVDNLYVINLKYKRQFSVFKKRNLGGGFFGIFDSQEEATKELEKASQRDEDPIKVSDYDVVDTGNHILLALDEEGNPSTPVIMSFQSTALKVSNNWNTMIQKESPNADRYATVWNLSTVREKNNRGSWFAPKVDFAGWASEELLAGAGEFFENLS